MFKNVVKLHAIESTNDFLKSRFRESELPNLHCVYTQNQTHGKGQRGTRWQSEAGKNLLFSVLYRNDDELNPFEVSQFISVVLTEFIKSKTDLQVAIKWPNDILAGGKKIAGILIENIFRKGVLTHSIIGVGLNVNQKVFDSLPRAGSLKSLTGRTFDIDLLLNTFIDFLHNSIASTYEKINCFDKYFYKYQKTALFKIQDTTVQAKILGTDASGRLLLEFDGYVKSYDLKEVVWIY
ncbi:MAG: biotin--[acetyl-CoA-carboxylase] ligase [Nonlabens sp.]